ncbi:8566_t:CDS:2 [Cetraspora pellucida]|uniref:8566_t:CDS:1 n=1 Tax=Cetraspora pellucida TaxID=1433469 RepID=A0ACA9M672_9GLOM|nr:8566_t:CDS:2 [Cetraspora pellucida]
MSNYVHNDNALSSADRGSYKGVEPSINNEPSIGNELSIDDELSIVSKNNELAKLSSISTSRPIVISDLMADLYDNEKSDKIIEEPEVNCYLYKPI